MQGTTEYERILSPLYNRYGNFFFEDNRDIIWYDGPSRKSVSDLLKNSGYDELPPLKRYYTGDFLQRTIGNGSNGRRFSRLVSSKPMSGVFPVWFPEVYKIKKANRLSLDCERYLDLIDGKLTPPMGLSVDSESLELKQYIAKGLRRFSRQDIDDILLFLKGIRTIDLPAYRDRDRNSSIEIYGKYYPYESVVHISANKDIAVAFVHDQRPLPEYLYRTGAYPQHRIRIDHKLMGKISEALSNADYSGCVVRNAGLGVIGILPAFRGARLFEEDQVYHTVNRHLQLPDLRRGTHTFPPELMVDFSTTPGHPFEARSNPHRLASGSSLVLTVGGMSDTEVFPSKTDREAELRFYGWVDGTKESGKPIQIHVSLWRLGK